MKDHGKQLPKKYLWQFSNLIYSYQNVNPVRFQKGNIVELAVSFFCIPTQAKKYKMITSLKSIILLDDKIREAHYIPNIYT